MIISPRCVGIDVSKRMLDIFDDALGAPERIANASQAITEQVARWRCGNVLVVFEATGVYDHELAEALRQALAGGPRPSGRQFIASLQARADSGERLTAGQRGFLESARRQVVLHEDES